jgi:L-threonylcarbamoyladenylate synthase
MDILKQNKNIIDRVVRELNNGKIVVCPTDTIYGFLADATNNKAVEKIFKIKKRPKSKPLAVFVKDIKMAKELAEINKDQEKILKQKWPGKYTFILKSKKTNLSKLVQNKETIGIRIPKYKFLNDLLKKVNKPLAQTSVNISGQAPLTKIKEIVKIFGSKPGIDLIVDGGDLKKSKPSQVSDFIQLTLTRLR